MTYSKPPESYPRRRVDGSWYVVVTWQNGRRERIGDFKTVADADEYIRLQLEAWLEGQKILGTD
jgi:hypothetical protein